MKLDSHCMASRAEYKTLAPFWGAGSEAVAWMLRERVAQTVGEALRLGNTLLKLGLLAHVVRAWLSARFGTVPIHSEAQQGLQM